MSSPSLNRLKEKLDQIPFWMVPLAVVTMVIAFTLGGCAAIANQLRQTLLKR